MWVCPHYRHFASCLAKSWQLKCWFDACQLNTDSVPKTRPTLTIVLEVSERLLIIWCKSQFSRTWLSSFFKDSCSEKPFWNSQHLRRGFIKICTHRSSTRCSPFFRCTLRLQIIGTHFFHSFHFSNSIRLPSAFQIWSLCRLVLKKHYTQVIGRWWNGLGVSVSHCLAAGWDQDKTEPKMSHLRQKGQLKTVFSLK